MKNYNLNDTIVALATPIGQSAIAVIRLSGTQALTIADKVFKGKALHKAKTHTAHYGHFMAQGQVIDEVMALVFKSPKSFTTEDAVEISVHGSPLIVQQALDELVNQGARLAQPGEFTYRAFINGRLDLSQAEAVADIIHAESVKAKDVALNQLKGNVSNKLKYLREQLLNFASLLELELDFAEEDVEFANRKQLVNLLNSIETEVNGLISSFGQGNAIKNGVPVAIVGEPNAGKSTLLNHLLQEEKAMVSDIAGTTRDYIEDVVYVKGIALRFIDTAGLRHTTDVLEQQGIERSKEKLKEAALVLMVADINNNHKAIAQSFRDLKITAVQKACIVLNKADSVQGCSYIDQQEAVEVLTGVKTIALSAKHGDNINELLEFLKDYVTQYEKGEATVITSTRHLHELKAVLTAIHSTLKGINTATTTDLIAMDMRDALHHLGLIVGEVSNDELLGNIFSKFCIGK